MELLELLEDDRMSRPVIKADNFSIRIHNQVLIDQLSLTLEAGEILGISGPSGCGKSTFLRSLMGLAPQASQITCDSLTMFGDTYQNVKPHDLRQYRGCDIAYISQNPYDAFNPVRTIGSHLKQLVKTHRFATFEEATTRFIEHLTSMNIQNGASLMHQYAFQLSGGMCQRVSIAMALVLNPKVIFADEPTSALDITSQISFVTLLKHLNQTFGISIILVSHHHKMLEKVCDRTIELKHHQPLTSETTTVVDKGRYTFKIPTRDRYA